MKVVVSIVSTGERQALETCLASIAAQTFGGETCIVVVENGRNDGSADVAQRAGARVIVNQLPRGFAENHNAAIASCDADFAIALNPDVVLDRRCVAELVSALERHARAGIMVPMLVFPSGQPQPSARRFPRVAGTIVRRTPLRRVFAGSVARSSHYLPFPEDDRPIDWALGACICARRSAWDSIGGFDSAYRPLYVEDVDVAWRMWEAGWEVWQTPRATAIHEHQAATDKVFLDKRTLWHARGMLRFVRKHPRILLHANPRPRAG